MRNIVLFVMIASALFAAENVKKVETKAPALTAEQKLKARELQLSETRALNRLQSLQLQFEQTQKELAATDQQLADFMKSACGPNYKLNIDTLACEEQK